MRRREFITMIGGAAAWPLAARAQQAAMPVVGLLRSGALTDVPHRVTVFRQGLKEAGFVEDQNVAIEYRSDERQTDRLPLLVADLLRRQVALIVGFNTPPALAAKAATTTVPIVFVTGGDPVRVGLVASLNRPGGNVTGVSLIGSALEAKRLEILHQLVPKAELIGVLVNPTYPDAERQRRELQDAADTLKQRIALMTASTENAIDTAFAALAQHAASAVLVAQDILFNTRRLQIVTLAARHRMPAIYNQREFTEIGGLISYGTHFADGYRQAGVYLGKILKGARPADLPVLQPTRFEMTINLKTARALGLMVPDNLLAIADEVIE